VKRQQPSWGRRFFKKKLVDHVAQQFQIRHGIDPKKNIFYHQQLKAACEKAKAALSTQQTTCLSLSTVPGLDGKMIDFNMMLDRKNL